MLRTHTCGELSLNDIGKQVTLCGWVQRVRDKGALIWVDLRDRYGITQLVLSQESASAALFSAARGLGREYVVQASGRVSERGSRNPKLATGEIEVALQALKVLNRAALPPFIVEDDTDGGEALRMEYRYLDLRRPCLQRNLVLKHKLTRRASEFLDAARFIGVETPMLVKSTPEGARDFLVPARGEANHYYALPQSPQTLKQLLMLGGLDRYYQFARCFRDEDLRADRQPEFTQLDCELSFVGQEEVLVLFERLIKHLFLTLKQHALPDFVRMTYEEAMAGYGSDKPDMRWGMRMHVLTEGVQGAGFSRLEGATHVAAIAVPGGAGFSRKQLDEITRFVQEENKKLTGQPVAGQPVATQLAGPFFVKYNAEGEVSSALGKWYSPEAMRSWLEVAGGKPGSLLIMLAGGRDAVQRVLGGIRLKVAGMASLVPEATFMPLWVTDFPLLAWDGAEQRYHAVHHPFTAPKEVDRGLLEDNPAAVRGQAYDLVINGVEIGGGSVRIHSCEEQLAMLSLLGFSREDAEKQFGFLMQAFKYGAPPHAGIAFGLDRLCMLLWGGESIREYIAFPKNNAGRDVMLSAPALVDGAR